jgi:hypothetical protein
LAPYLYLITNNVNIEAYANTAGGTDSVEGVDILGSRLAAFVSIGTAVQLYLLAHYPVGTWLSPRRLWVVCLFTVSTMLVVLGGYRSGLFNYTLAAFLGFACYYSWRALLLPLVACIAFMMLYVGSENNFINLPLNRLPMIAQRTMSFLPGDWDPEAIESGKSSNEFRQNIINVYLGEYAKKSPLLGNGFDIDKSEIDYLMSAKQNGQIDSFYGEAKLYIESKSYHTGWISVYDCIGIIGWGAYLWFQLTIIFISGSFIFRRSADRRSALFPLYVWIFCSMTTEIIAYYTVFGVFAGYYSDELGFATVIMHLCRIRQENKKASLITAHNTQVEFSGLSQAPYGNKYY